MEIIYIVSLRCMYNSETYNLQCMFVWSFTMVVRYRLFYIRDRCRLLHGHRAKQAQDKTNSVHVLYAAGDHISKVE